VSILSGIFTGLIESCRLTYSGQKKATEKSVALFYQNAKLSALDLFQHLEYAFRGFNEQALESLAQATTFEGITTHTFALSHDDLR
jgi:hypothetical protein